MVRLMNNSSAESLLRDTYNELRFIERLVNKQGKTHSTTPFLNKYAIIKACGTIEVSFKAIISDYFTDHEYPQAANFVNKRVRDSSMNPDFGKILELLMNFDVTWGNDFKTGVNSLRDSTNVKKGLEDLKIARNNFSHGGNPGMEVRNVIRNYLHGVRIINVLDSVVCKQVIPELAYHL
jgi:hypothetical protein